MPVFNLTIPDTSPLIVYAGGYWGDSSHADPEWNGYMNGTFHATQDNGATASLTFNGSAVYVFGAKRSNHGQYQATLDGSSTVGNGYSASDVFNQSLYSQANLVQTEQHRFVLTNQWAESTDTWFDVDYMLITSGDGNPNTPSVDIIMDDGHQNITYSPGWTSTPNNLTQFYYNETMHVTQTLGASASVSFYGNAITVYGATSTSHGSFSVSLDGIPIPSNFNGTASVFRPQNMLYYSGGLSTSLHNLIMMNTDTTGLYFDLDKVVVSTWPTELVANSTSTSPTTISTSGTAASSTGTSTTSSNVNSAAIIGGTVAAVAVVALLIGLFFLIRRRRGRAHYHETDIDSSSSEEGHVQPFVVEPRASPPNNVRAVDHSQISWSASATASYVYDTSKATMASSTSATEAENPHRDFPPPDYDEATASSRRALAS